MKITLLAAITAPILVLAQPTLVAIDGDTIKELNNTTNKYTRLRLAYIDAPETLQQYGSESTEFLQTILNTCKDLHIVRGALDYYKRQLVVIQCEGENINKAIVRGGYAWAYSRSPKNPYFELEQHARVNKFGLWTNPNAINPALFRKIVKHKTAE